MCLDSTKRYISRKVSFSVGYNVVWFSLVLTHDYALWKVSCRIYIELYLSEWNNKLVNREAKNKVIQNHEYCFNTFPLFSPKYPPILSCFWLFFSFLLWWLTEFHHVGRSIFSVQIIKIYIETSYELTVWKRLFIQNTNSGTQWPLEGSKTAVGRIL